MDTPNPFDPDRIGADLVRKVTDQFPMLPTLREDLQATLRERVRLQPGHTILSLGDTCDGTFLLEDGWVVRSRWLPGGGRQIVNIALPGDFLCSSSLVLARSEYDLVARTEGSMVRLRPPPIDKLVTERPGLATALMWAAAHENSLLSERVVSLGRRDALERLAHVICELATRLEHLGRHSGEVLTLPLIQEDFADILGLSSIHVTRTFRRLSEMGALDYRSGRLRLKRMDILRRLAGFDPGYLRFSQPKNEPAAPQS